MESSIYLEEAHFKEKEKNGKIFFRREKPNKRTKKKRPQGGVSTTRDGKKKEMLQEIVKHLRPKKKSDFEHPRKEKEQENENERKRKIEFKLSRKRKGTRKQCKK